MDLSINLNIFIFLGYKEKERRGVSVGWQLSKKSSGIDPKWKDAHAREPHGPTWSGWSAASALSRGDIEKQRCMSFFFARALSQVWTLNWITLFSL